MWANNNNPVFPRDICKSISPKESKGVSGCDINKIKSYNEFRKVDH